MLQLLLSLLSFTVAGGGDGRGGGGGDGADGVINFSRRRCCSG